MSRDLKKASSQRPGHIDADLVLVAGGHLLDFGQQPRKGSVLLLLVTQPSPAPWQQRPCSQCTVCKVQPIEPGAAGSRHKSLAEEPSSMI